MITATVLAGGEDQQKAAPLGLFVLLLLGVACYFLFKSMSRHLKRVREDFPITGPSGSGRPSTPDASIVLSPRRPNPGAPLGTNPGAPLRVDPTSPRIIDSDLDGDRDAGPR